MHFTLSIATLGIAFGLQLPASAAELTTAGGIVTDMSLASAVCKNTTTGQSVKINSPGRDATLYDCSAAGLVVSEGDKLKLTITATAADGRSGLSDGLTARYDFNGGAQDKSGNSYHGTPENVAPAADKQNVAARAYSFNGTNALVRLPALPTPTTNTFTISAWIYPNACETDLDGGIVGPDGWSSGRVVLSLSTVDSTCRLHGAEYNTQPLKITGPGEFEFYGARAVLMNQWQHVAWTMDAERMVARFYLNGELDSEIPYRMLNGLTVPDLSGLTVGLFGPRNSHPLRYFKGVIDEVRIYSGKALGPVQMKALYNLGA